MAHRSPPAKPLPPPTSAAWQVVHLQPRAPAKPAWGAPCNGCGLCCLVEPCPLGMLLSRKRHGPCDALRWDEAQGLYRCGAISEPASVLRWRWAALLLPRLARRWVAAGRGCDAHLTPGPER
jgi:hypothetical protein